MIWTFHHEVVLHESPDLDARDLAVVDAIDHYRSDLRHYLSSTRRWQGQIRRNLRARAMRGSNSIEGYDVSLDDAIGLLADDEALDADANTLMEVRGYRNAITYILQLSEDPDFQLDQSLVRSLHFMMLGHDLAKSPGSYRKSEIYVRDEDNDEIVYEGPDPTLVADLMAELVFDVSEGMRASEAAVPVYVRAAMAHLNLVMIHPFRDGNGRMARALQTLVLARDRILTPEFSSVEEWLGRNTSAYYDILSSTAQGSWSPQLPAHDWVRFNLRAHHMQAQTVQARVRESEVVWNDLTGMAGARGLPLRLVLALYDAALGLKVRRSVYEVDAEIEPATASRDLRNAVSAGLLSARGETRGRFYVAAKELGSMYADIRRQRPKLIDPYAVDVAALAPKRRPRLSTAGR